MFEIRGKHGFTPKYTDVQAPTAAMNIHRHSRCHYKRNSGSTPAGTNNLHIGGPAGRQTPGGSLATSAAAAMALRRTLPLKGSRSCPLMGDENQPLKPKSRRPGAQVTLTISSAEKPSPAATTSAPTAASTCPPTPHLRAPTAPKRTGRSSLPSSPRKREWDRPRTRVLPSRRMTCCETPPVRPATIARAEDGMLHPGQAAVVCLPPHGWRTPPLQS
jgi:hypothetical protein